MPASSHTSAASAAIVSCARERRVSSASGSIIVAEMREMTSPPNGCWALSSDWTASGWPESRSSSVATTVVVPRSKASAWRAPVVSPGSTSIISSSTTTAVTLKAEERRTPPSLRTTSSGMWGSRSSMASSRRWTSERWSSIVGSSSST